MYRRRGRRRYIPPGDGEDAAGISGLATTPLDGEDAAGISYCGITLNP